MNSSYNSAQAGRSFFELLDRKPSTVSPVAVMGEKSLVWSYDVLAALVLELQSQFSDYGVAPHHRVAIAVESGPILCALLLGLGSRCTVVPLNPALRQLGAEFALKTLGIDLLVVQTGSCIALPHAAASLDVPVVEAGYRDTDTVAMTFPRKIINDNTPIAAPPDTGVLLTTSGSTARPKQVLLNQSNLCISAGNVALSLNLDVGDVGLSIMPLFHVHGLVAGLLAPLAAGSVVVCTSNLKTGKFTEWLEDFQPTWYSASPTVHREILDAHRRSPAIHRLRFIRSSSAFMTRALSTDLEAVFGCPLIEAYGMTEAIHQVCSNPLPPASRKIGSVGPATNTEVIIICPDDSPMEVGKIGEIAIRGQNVVTQYLHGSEVDDSAFRDGWFYTGDQGYLDEDGYLYLTGRLKEIINRGGEKVQPAEVDKVLADHPDVYQVVAFGVPHQSLGEDLVSAVVPRKNTNLTEANLRSFALKNLSSEKVPSRYLILDELPDSDSLKLKRTTVADKLRHMLVSDYVKPQTNTEKTVADVFEQVLNLNRVGRDDNFFSLGGNSLQVTMVLSRLQNVYGTELPIESLFFDPTVRELAACIATHRMEQEEANTRTLLDDIENLSDEEAQRMLDSLAAQ